MAWDADLDKASVGYKIAAALETEVRVIAGPGTGKSFAMKRRVARLLEEKVTPKKILAVTFTRVAAEDLHRELVNLNVPGCDELEGVTLHSLAMKILSRQHVLQSIGRVPRPLNKFELAAMHADISDACGGKKKCKKLVKAYEAAWAQSQGDEPGFAKTEAEKAFQKSLVEWLDFHQAMLIGEVIPFLVKYLKENPKAKEHSEYEHLLVDEYQDLNKAEQTAIAYLAANAKICVVGDDDQSIYSFKNAHPEGIREWAKNHPKCADFAMADCHRCPTNVVTMANAVIDNNVDRVKRVLNPIKEKGFGETKIVQLANPDMEANWIAKEISTLLNKGAHPSEIIVLIQRSRAAKKIIEALKVREIPAKSYYEESQLEEEEAQKRFALLKLFLDKEDRVALRYLLGCESSTFCVGPYGKLRKYCEENGDSPWKALEKLASGKIKIKNSRTLSERFDEIRSDIDLLGQAENMESFIDLAFPEDQKELADIRELALFFSELADGPKELFSLMMEEMTQPDIPPTVEEVRVMSLHKCKGLSSPYVFIAGCIQGMLPQAPDPDATQEQKKAKLEEARRLFFVAITRVKADPKKKQVGSLFITYPKEMNAGLASGTKIAFSKVVNGNAQLFPSKFIGELGPTAPAPIAG